MSDLPLATCARVGDLVASCYAIGRYGLRQCTKWEVHAVRADGLPVVWRRDRGQRLLERPEKWAVVWRQVYEVSK